MGIIIRQSVKGAFWSYLGIVIGYINVGIIMPQFFDTAQMGLVQLFASVSLIFAQFGTLGFTSVINRLFSRFRNHRNHHNGFLFLALTTGLLGFTLTVAAFMLLKPWIIETNTSRSPLIVEYLYLLMPLVLMRILFILLDNYNKMLYDAVTGTFWLEFMHKVINLLLILLFLVGWIDFRLFFTGYILSMSLPVIPVIIVLIRGNNFSLKPQISFWGKSLRRETGETMLFGFINGLAGIMLVNVDRIFVNQYLSLSEVGVFSVCALFATLIRIPYNAVLKIATGILAESWKKNDMAHIQEIYQKSALNQAIIGTLIFVGILVNLGNIFRILPPEYGDGKGVLIIYSAGILVSTVIGLAGNITEISGHFRYNTLFLGLSVALQFVLSFLLIPRYGIVGAALSTMITLVVNALLQAALQRIAYGIFGLKRELLWIAAIGLVSYAVGRLIPALPLISDILLRSTVVVLTYGVSSYILRVSPEVNMVVEHIFRRIFTFRHP